MLVSSSYRNNVVALIGCLAGIAVITLILPSHYTNASSNSSNASTIKNVTLTPNQIAAGGPIPINYTLAQKESLCAAAESNAPWTRTLVSYEQHDTNRSKVFPCATFTGSLTAPNSVYAYRSPDTYPTLAYMATRGINEMYWYGGSDYDANPQPTVSYVSRVEPGSLKELWRTSLFNANISRSWEGAGSMGAIGNDLIVIDNVYLYKLNTTTGAVEKVLPLPTGASSPKDTYFNGLDGWPDGTLVVKNLNRAPGCTIPGLSAAFKCPNINLTPPSTLTAVDSKTFKVLDSVQLPGNIGARPTSTMYHGKDYIYLSNLTGILRYEWNGKNLTLDKSWGVRSFLLPGQAQAGAPAVMGDWVFVNTNVGPANASMSVIAISQANSSKITRIQPMPLKPGQISVYPFNIAVDRENNRIYAVDAGPGKVAAINFNQKTGNMTLAWSTDQWTQETLQLVGPANHRVIVGSNMLSNVTNPNDLVPGPKGVNYKEQVQWRDAATGKLLAASDYFSPGPSRGQLFVGYGGLVYDGLNAGHLMAVKALPTAANSTSTTTTAASTPNSTSTTAPNSTSTAPMFGGVFH